MVLSCPFGTNSNTGPCEWVVTQPNEVFKEKPKGGENERKHKTQPRSIVPGAQGMGKRAIGKECRVAPAFFEYAQFQFPLNSKSLTKLSPISAMLMLIYTLDSKFCSFERIFLGVGHNCTDREETEENERDRRGETRDRKGRERKKERKEGREGRKKRKKDR